MKHPALTLVTLALVSAAGLSACGSDNGPDYTQVCTSTLGVRVDDTWCGRPGYSWVYLPSTLTQPAIGAQVVRNGYYSSSITRTKPKAATVRSVPKAGAPAVKQGSSNQAPSQPKVNLQKPSRISSPARVSGGRR